MNEILLYRGCTIPVRLPAYEASTIAVLEKLGVKIIPMENVTCCGAQYVESMSSFAFAALTGRILAIAESEGKDILTICGACSGSLKINKDLLDHDKTLRDEVNALLVDEGIKYSGKVRVRHLLQVLAEDIGFDKIERAIVKPYNGLKVAAHYGCHVTRPFEICQVDDPENPTILDRIVEIAGGQAVNYEGKTRCCGGPMLAMDEGLATKIGREKIGNIISAGAQAVVTACGFCDLQLNQVQFGNGFDESRRIPVMPITQFLGPAIGIEQEKLGLELNRINPDRVLKALQGGST